MRQTSPPPGASKPARRQALSLDQQLVDRLNREEPPDSEWTNVRVVRGSQPASPDLSTHPDLDDWANRSALEQALQDNPELHLQKADLK